MANNYQESSSFLKLGTKEQIAEAMVIYKSLCDEVEELLNGEEVCDGVEIEDVVFYAGVDFAAIPEDEGIWIHGGESLDAEHVALYVERVQEALKLDEPFFCSWSYTCSKPRVDEFGGGAFVAQRGHQTRFVDAMGVVETVAENWKVIEHQREGGRAENEC